MRNLVLGAVGLLVFCSCGQGPVRTPLGSTYELAARPEVWRVLPHSQAENAGLRSGDLLLSYNGEPVRTNDEVLVAQGRVEPGKKEIEVVVLRDDSELKLTAKPGHLGVMPVAAKYPSSLALALEDIMRHFGLFTDYDWLAALSGESFTFTAKEDECRAWWPGGKSDVYPVELAEAAGLSLRRICDGTGAADHSQVIRGELLKGQAVLVHGGWPEHRGDFWGVAARYDADESTVCGYCVDAAGELPLVGPVRAAYVVSHEGPWQEPRELLAGALQHALELNQVYADTGWKSGIDAYDLLLKSLDSIPFCPVCGENESRHCFERLLWVAIAHKESSVRFLEAMKLAMPDKVELFDNAISDARAVLGKLEGINRSGVRPGTAADQRKLAFAVGEIEIIENDLIGQYELLLGGL